MATRRDLIRADLRFFQRLFDVRSSHLQRTRLIMGRPSLEEM